MNILEKSVYLKAEDYHKKYMKKEIVEKLSSLIIAAFGLVAALAWNGAIQAIFKELFGTAEGVMPMIVYAVVVTVIAVVVTIWVAKVAGKKE